MDVASWHAFGVVGSLVCELNMQGHGLLKGNGAELMGSNKDYGQLVRMCVCAGVKIKLENSWIESVVIWQSGWKLKLCDDTDFRRANSVKAGSLSRTLNEVNEHLDAAVSCS
ncbi:hypothetical protein SARC_07186 [Sphaeroforma arctica JP610]|uniref:Uncharacterized protein n=1 Tax=Sphaeroforma arctica JP610 TaxID=667725 RepID=A0A0L0FUY0_9EUKA|nr:hypothetical protein SARC_07186 [Sphaeroforma arctica JP610]KNC80449.1 hypothetical protein SARC_07186 [Sphaeroforma arctica JP610]|eukprot:XP_014154351.1 hypothetical protein SARC_07186 [Sphaeroforma arctica JP610]